MIHPFPSTARAEPHDSLHQYVLTSWAWSKPTVNNCRYALTSMSSIRHL